MIDFVGRIHPQAVFALFAMMGFGGAGQAIQPRERFLDLVALESDR